MVKQGFAWNYVKYTQGKEFKEAQAIAREGRIGLWQDAKPVPP